MTTIPAARRPRRHPRDRERGSATVEMLLGFPLLVVAFMLGVLGFRVAVAHVEVATAAAAAARDASLQRTPAAAQATATGSATAALETSQLTCDPLQVTPDVSGHAPGGAVTVQVTCTVDVSDLTGLAIPAQISISGAATQPVDTHRANTPGGATGGLP